MYIKDINSLNNINFNSKLKKSNQIKNNSINKITAPVIMGILTAQMLKEQTLNSNFEAQQQKGYLNKQLTKEEKNRGQKLADCFNFYKNQGEVIFNIMTILTKSERNINDNFFIKKFFEFIESDFSQKTKICLFEILSEPKDNELLQTALTNFTTYASDSDNIEARFTIADLYTLKDIYSRSKNKELILDMIKEGIIVDEESELKAYRFETNEILNLNKCYIDTPNKDLFLTLINQYEYNESINENCPLYNADMIVNLVQDCFSKDKAKFLKQICCEKIIKNNKKENRFTGESVFIFNKIYNDYPKELEFLVNQKITINNINKPRFNTNEIVALMKKYRILGEPVINIVKNTNNDNFDFTLLLQIINEVEIQKNKKRN